MIGTKVKYQNDRGGGYLRNVSGSVFASIPKRVSLVEFAKVQTSR